MSLIMDIHKKFKDFTLDITLHNKGQRLGILGASGCGKSMTLKCIAGIENPDFGTIILNNRSLFNSEKKINIPPQRRKIGYLFQNYALFPNMTVKQNIAIGIDKAKDRKTVIEEMMELLQIKELGNRYPMQLSGGQQQRVALARILAYEPELLLLDEPFSALDSYLKEQLEQELLDTVKNYKIETLMVSHSRDELYLFCDHLAVIDQGKLIAVGDTCELFTNPSYVAAARLTGCKNISKAYKLSDNTIHMVDWNLNLKTDQMVQDDIKYAGIRAHDIRLEGKEGENNCLAVTLMEITEGVFEYNMIFMTSNKSKIWCKAAKTDWNNILRYRIPRYISLPKEHIVLLK